MSSQTRPLRVLIMINGAQEHRPFYSKVGRELAARGHHVHFFLDSHYTDFLYPDAKLDPERSHYFSDYFRANSKRTKLPPEISDLNVWTMAFPDIDRLMFTRFGRRAGDSHFYESLLANLGHFFVDLFDQYHFDTIVYENVSNTIAYFAFEIGRRRGARYLGFVPSRLPGRSDAVDYKFARDTRLEHVFEEMRSGRLVVPADVKRWVRDYLANFDQKVPDYVGLPHPFHMGLWERYAHARPFQRFTRSIAYRFLARKDLEHSLIGDPVFLFPEQFAKEAIKHAKRRLLDARFYERAPDLSVPYFVYPIQFHPESATSVDGAAFNDEWNNVTGIARNLPFGVKLYVKDHKHAAGREPLSFYEKITRIPNVVLVHPNFDAKALMRNAAAVVVSTTTMGYEALVLGKPVFVLGHPFYDFFPTCIRVPSFDGAHELFSGYASIRSRQDDIEALVSAYYVTSEGGTFDILSQYDDAGAVRRIADIVVRRMTEPSGEKLVLDEKRMV